MATYVDTLMGNWVMQNPQLDSMENRAREYGAFDMAMALSNAPDSPITAETKALAAGSIGRTIKIPVLKKLALDASNSRSCSASDNDGVSALVEVSWTTLSQSFTILRNRMNNNYITTQREFNHKMNAVRQAILKGADDLILTALSTNKSQVMNDSLNYTVASNTVNATWKQREFLLGDLHSMMLANDFGAGNFHVVGNTGIEATMRHLGEHAVYNDVNKALELNGMTFHYDRGLSNANGKYGTLYAVQSGSLAVLFRFTRPQMANDKSGTHEFGTTYMPGFGQIGYHYTESVGDYHAKQASGIDDMTCDVLESYIFDVDMAVVPAYNSALGTYPSPIIKADITSGSFENAVNVTLNNSADNPLYNQVVTP